MNVYKTFKACCSFLCSLYTMAQTHPINIQVVLNNLNCIIMHAAVKTSHTHTHTHIHTHTVHAYVHAMFLDLLKMTCINHPTIILRLFRVLKPF